MGWDFDLIGSMFEADSYSHVTATNTENALISHNPHHLAIEQGVPLIVTILFGLLFIIGTCGNAATFGLVQYIRAKDSRSRKNPVLSYISVQCVIDFLSMMPIPVIMIHQVLGNWIFDSIGCKIFLFSEHTIMLFSAFLMITLCFHRHFRYRDPEYEFEAKEFIISTFVMMLLINHLMLLPVFVLADVKETGLTYERFDPVDGTVVTTKILKCYHGFVEHLNLMFAGMWFTFGFLFPLLWIISFGTNCYQNRRLLSFEERKILGEIKGFDSYMIARCSMHVILWLPYWISVFYPGTKDHMDSLSFLELRSSNADYFVYFLIALPYINSAVGFLLYRYLDIQFLPCFRSKQAKYITTAMLPLSSPNTPMVLDTPC